MITKEQGLKQIDEAKWELDEYATMNLYVQDKNGDNVHAFIQMRPSYCDRGHLMLNIDGYINLDSADRFPRYFFSAEEADQHTRAFLKWRLWKERTHYDVLADLLVLNPKESNAHDG